MAGALVDPDDLPPGDEKGRAALARYRLEQVDDARSPAFDAAYRRLDAEFGARGELERREVVERWLGANPRRIDGLLQRYHLLVARAPNGELAGVRDCHVSVDAAAQVCVVYLAHVLVLPAHRRRGLASLLRAAPVTLARHALRAAGVDEQHAEVLLAGEMEPIDVREPATLVRLIAYGRAGFRAIAPSRLPYCQPDFTGGKPPKPVPLLAVVRRAGHDEGVELPLHLARAYLQHLFAVFASHCPAAQLAPLRRHALERLADGADPLPLCTLPRHEQDAERIAPLTREAALREQLPEVVAFSAERLR